MNQYSGGIQERREWWDPNQENPTKRIREWWDPNQENPTKRTREWWVANVPKGLNKGDVHNKVGKGLRVNSSVLKLK